MSAIDAQFHAVDQAFVDLGKQVTTRGSYLYPSPIREGQVPQSFLYKRCCLESFFQWYCAHALDREGKREAEEPDNLPKRHLLWWGSATPPELSPDSDSNCSSPGT
jgi:hypothetical protein